MGHIFGWWDAFPKGRTLINRASGQRVRLVGVWLDEQDTEDARWLRFEYEDDEVCYPVVARLIRGDYVDPEFPRRRKTGQILRIDHNRSAIVWRRETGAATDSPPYGLWRRVDDCITDAFACWPALPRYELALGQVGIRGGWLNGDWRENFVRTFPALTEKIKQGVAVSQGVLEAERPLVMPLDAEPPSPWRFHGFPEGDAPNGEVSPDLGHFVGLDNRTKVYNSETRSSYWIVPAGELLTGIAGRTAYMSAEDGSRVLYPKFGTTLNQERGGTQFSFEYADREFMGSISAVNDSLAEPATWSWNLQCIRGELRGHESGDSASVVRIKPGVCVPTYLLWLRLSWTLIDAWLFWKGTHARFHDLTPELALIGASSITIKGRYLGGVWPARMYCQAWLDEEVAL